MRATMGLESSELHKARSPQIPCLQVLRIVPKHLRWSTKAQQVTHMASDQHVTATWHFRIELASLQALLKRLSRLVSRRCSTAMSESGTASDNLSAGCAALLHQTGSRCKAFCPMSSSNFLAELRVSKSSTNCCSLAVRSSDLRVLSFTMSDSFRPCE